MRDIKKEQGKQLWMNRVSRILFCLLVLGQFALAVLFLVNKKDFTGFVSETPELELGVRSGIIDEYVGPLYPLLLRGAIFLQRAAFVPYYVFVYLVHAVLFLVAITFLVSAVYKGISKYIVILTVCTMPLTMHCFFQISPFLLRCIFGMFFVGCLIRIYKRTGHKVFTWIGLALSYFLAAMNVPDDGYLWGIVLFVFIIRFFTHRSRKQMICVFVSVICLVAVTIFIQKKTEISGGYGRMQRTVSATVFSNCMWENRAEKNDFLQNRFQSKYGIINWPSLQTREELQRTYGAQFDYQLGTQKANRFYREASLALIKKYGVSIVADVVKLWVGQIWNTIATNWTALLIGMIFLLDKVKKKKTIGKVLTFAIVYELVFVSLARGPLWDERFSLLGWILILLFLAQKDRSSLDDKIASYWAQTKKYLQQKKQNIIVFGVLFVIGAFVVGSFWAKSIQSRKEKLSGRVVCLGDSIWGFYRGVGGIGAFLEEETGFQVETYAVPGTAVCKRPGDDTDGECLESIVEALAGERAEDDILEETGNIVDNLHLDRAQMVVLAYGLNDYFSGFAPEDYGKGLERAIQVIHDINPDVVICVIGPTQCLNYQNGVVVSTGSDVDLGGGILDDYSRAAREVSATNHTLFIDMREEMPLTRYNDEHMTKDGTHLTEYGRKKYAKVLVKGILRNKEFYSKLANN